MKGENNITSKQMALLTFIAQTGVSMITFPTLIVRRVGHDAWITVVITGVLAIILGTVLNVLFSVYLLLGAASNTRVFSVFLEMTLLPRTPAFIIIPFVLLPSVYLVGCGLKYVVRFKYISCVSYIFSFTYLLFLKKSYRFSFLLPLGEAGPLKILGGIRTGFFGFLGLELIAFLFPKITDKENAKKWHGIAIGLSTIFSSTIVAAATALFGENLLKLQTIPLFSLARIYNAPVLERLDLYLIAMWFVVMGCSMRVYMFAAYDSLEQVFKIKENKYVLLIFFIVLIFFSRIPRDLNQVFMFREIISFVAIGIYIFLMLCLILSFIKRNGVNTNEKN